MKINKILSIIIASIAIILNIVGIIIVSKSNEISVVLMVNAIVNIVALAIFIVAILFLKKNKIYVLIPILILLVTISYFSNLVNELLKEISNAITSETTETQPDYTALGVVLLGGLVVGYVFALKDKKWAKILVYVIMGLLIVELYQSLLGVNTFAVLLKKEIENSSSGVGISTNEEFMNMIKELKNKGTSIIFSSHRMEHVELFCDQLLILVNGKTVLQGNLATIKKDYHKKSIRLIAPIEKEKVLTIPGVLGIEEAPNNCEYLVKIADDSVVKDVYNYLKTLDNVTKFVVEEPSLNEIFISKVGESYEK